MPITFPHFGTTTYVFESVMKELGRGDLVVPSKPNKRTVNLGSLHSPEFVCTPFKITLGSFIESLENGATELAFGASQGTCRLGYYWPVQKLILEDLGFDFKFILFDWDDPIQCLKCFKDLSDGCNVLQTLRALRIGWIKHRLIDQVDRLLRKYRALELTKGKSESIAKKAYRMIVDVRGMRNIRKMEKEINEMFSKVETNGNTNPIKIRIIGEIYVVHEPILNLDIYKRLNELGVICNTPNTVRKQTDLGHKLNPFIKMRYKKVREIAKPHLPYNCGGCAQDSIGETILSKREQWDGMIHLYPFTCLPEIIARSILPQISREHQMAVLSLVVDEQTGEAGFQTRLEAFVDLLKRRREKATT
jgi:predicted nucleotide-binding protein (sugar kinase/HSP70/actin superfamily)